ncbi:hypothetical protein C8J56DRAFT_408361 [Mycena floridula]|nr:hypothetical protein C8J56DRAFT_408361 [Mycena floridula]
MLSCLLDSRFTSPLLSALIRRWVLALLSSISCYTLLLFVYSPYSSPHSFSFPFLRLLQSSRSLHYPCVCSIILAFAPLSSRSRLQHLPFCFLLFCVACVAPSRFLPRSLDLGTLFLLCISFLSTLLRSFLLTSLRFSLTSLAKLYSNLRHKNNQRWHLASYQPRVVSHCFWVPGLIGSTAYVMTPPTLSPIPRFKIPQAVSGADWTEKRDEAGRIGKAV